MINFDLTTTKEMIATEEENLRKYLSDKEEFYTKTRIRRVQRAQKADNN
jgi:hypothetical protein